MMKPDKKKILGLILSKKEDDEEMPKEEGGSDLETIAQELIDAIKEGDASAVSDALKSFYELCGE